MKHEETYAISEAMRDDLIAAYRDVYENCVTQVSAWRMTVRHPAKGWYVTGKQVAQILSPLLQTGQQPQMPNKNKERKYTALLALVKELMNRRENVGKSLVQLCELAVKQPAPEFFISQSTARRLITKAKADQIKQMVGTRRR